MRIYRSTTVAASLVGLALLIGGCGAAASPHPASHKVSPPKASPSATPTPSPVNTSTINCHALPPSNVSLAQAVTGHAQIPYVKAPANDPWASMDGTKALPPNWESYIPPVMIVNNTNSVSNCTATEWGYGFLKDIALSNWAEYWDAPFLNQSTATPGGEFFYGGSTGEGQLLQGDRWVVTPNWPTKLVLVQLTPVFQSNYGISSTYAFIMEYPSKDWSDIVIFPNGKTNVTTGTNGISEIVPGTFETNYQPISHPDGWTFGAVFVPNDELSCNTGNLATVMCSNAGVLNS